MTVTVFYGKLTNSDAEVDALQQFLSKINWIDVVVLIVLIRTAYVGWRRGLASEVLGLAGTFIVFFLSLTYYDELAGILADRTPIPYSVAKFICLLFLLIILIIVIRIVCRYLEKVGKLVIMPVLDRYGGLAFGICRGLIIGSLFVLVLKVLPISYIRESIEERSFSARYMERTGATVYGIFKRH